MFTGIIETTSKVLSHQKAEDGLVFAIERPDSWGLEIGQSIAVNGVCLTVTSFDDKLFSVTLVAETLDKTTFGLAVPKTVNLERALQHGSRLDGHMVQGHVDATGRVVGVVEDGISLELSVTFDASFDALLIQKGSVAIDGVSLTVTRCDSGKLSVVLIPHTVEVTTLGELREGDAVNLEFDIIGKYINKQNKN